MFANSKPPTDEDRISQTRVLSPETFLEALETDPDIEPLGGQDRHAVNQPGGGTCLGELVLDPHSVPVDLVWVLQVLKTHLTTHIVSVEHLKRGVTVTLTCTLDDMVTFLGMLPNLPRVDRWSFNLN